MSKRKTSKKDGEKYETEVVQDVKLISHERKVYIQPHLRDDVLNWYHHYLQHPVEIRMYKPMSQTIYWPGLNGQCVRLCKKYKIFQLLRGLRQKYGKLPPKDDDLKPWNTCVSTAWVPSL